jgi:hypothetical protein
MPRRSQSKALVTRDIKRRSNPFAKRARVGQQICKGPPEGCGTAGQEEMIEWQSSAVTIITAICGVVFGFGGLLLSILNWFRDRPKLVVTLKWDMAVTDNPSYDPKKRWGLVRVTNVGRRPAYITAVALKIPKAFNAARKLNIHILSSETQ